ncbi:hypothetical protein BH09PSE5_BH09PSE5_32970 [soil metagenome]
MNAPASILVAEDNEANRKMIASQLELLGYSADCAVDGVAALERWRGGSQSPYCLLLTDLNMPGMDGFQLAEAIRGEETAGAHLPILALTADAPNDGGTRCRASGIDVCLSKPARLVDLKRAIESLLGPPLRGAFAAPKAVLADKPKPDDPVPASALAVDVAASVDQSCEPAADLGFLKALIGDDPAIIASVLDAFRASSSSSVQAITDGVATGNWQAAQDAAHSLKSAARYVGATRLGNLCADIETASAAGDADALKALAARFVDEAELVRRFIDSA